jgi:hypothetical protein
MDEKAMNIKPEAAWSLLRWTFTTAFEDMFTKGVVEDGNNHKLYDLLNPLHR